jgi:hypothetical protein
VSVDDLLRELAGASVRVGILTGEDRARHGNAGPWNADAIVAAVERERVAFGAVRAELVRLRMALAWYAEPAHHASTQQREHQGAGILPLIAPSEVQQDGGERARKALAS